MDWPHFSHRARPFCVPGQLVLVRAWHGDGGCGCFRVAATHGGATGEGSLVREAGPRLPVSDVAFRGCFLRRLRPVVPRQTCFPSLGPWAQYSVMQGRRCNRGECRLDADAPAASHLGKNLFAKPRWRRKLIISLQDESIMRAESGQFGGAFSRGKRREVRFRSPLERATLRTRYAALSSAAGDGGGSVSKPGTGGSSL